MGQTTEEIIYKITLDVASTTQGLKDFVATATQAKKVNQEMVESQGQVEEAAKRQEAANKKTNEAVKAEADSITALRKEMKQLTEIRNATTTSTEAGRAKIAQVNKLLDEHNKTIKANVDSYTKQKMSVGDYTGALDKMVPGLGSTIQGFQGMTKAALAFLATPIGIVIGALGLALGALTAYFKGSEEGQDKLASAMAVGKVVIDGVILVVEKLGEVLFTAIEFIGNLALSVVEKVAPSIAKTLNDAIAAGHEIADLQDKIDADENDFIMRRAAVNKQVAEIREGAIKLEGDAKRAQIQKAIDLEKDLAAAETEHLQEKLKLIDLDIASTGKATEEQKKARAEAVAAVTDSEAKGFEATLRFNKELEKLNDERRKREDDIAKAKQAGIDKLEDIEVAVAQMRKKRDEEQAARNQAAIDALLPRQLSEQELFDLVMSEKEELAEADRVQNEQETQNDDKKTKAKLDNLKAIEAAVTNSVKVTEGIAVSAYTNEIARINNQVAAITNAANKNLIKVQGYYAQEQAALDQQLAQGLISQEDHDARQKELLIYQTAQEKLIKDAATKDEFELKKKAFEANKKAQIIQSTIDMVQAALGAFRAMIGVPFVGPILAPIAAAAALVFGAEKIKTIQDQQFPGFFEGGYTGHGNPRGESSRLGKRWYKYHNDEYITPSRVLNTQEGMYHVRQLEKLRRSGSNSFSAVGFADGGLAIENRQALNLIDVAESNSILKDMRQLLADQRTVLVLEQFETVQDTRNQVETKSIIQ